MTSPAKPIQGHRAAVFASFLGWTLDAFDFFLVSFALTAIAKDFGRPDKDIAFTITITLAFRPLGAILFGLMADRYGRRIPLMLNLVFFSIIEVASGFASSYVSFLVLRALFGIGMGGEWGLGASLAMEKAPTKSRGLLSGFLQEGYACGNLLAAICYFFVFPRWGWRPMFIIGGLPALLALFVRYRVTESEVWERNRHRDWSGLGKAIFSHWKLFLGLTAFMTAMSFVSHGTQDMYPTFLQRDWGFTPQKRSMLTAISMLGAIAGGLFGGMMSDKFGRRRAIMFALAGGIIAIPLWAFSTTLPLLIIGAIVMQFMVQAAWGVVPVHLNELAPNSVRGFIPGFAYQCGVMLAGSVVYIEAAVASHGSYAIAMGITGLIVFSVALFATWLSKERSGVDFG